jgi:hypothetical protein
MKPSAIKQAEIATAYIGLPLARVLANILGA